MSDPAEIERLQQIANRCRLGCLRILESSGVGHTGGSMSVIDILVTLYFHVARVRANDPDWPERDRIVLSKAHASEGMYAVLGEAGFFPKELFSTYGVFGSPLQAHTASWAAPGVEYSGGSLGQGLSFAIGVALGQRLNRERDPKNPFLPANPRFYIYCVLGDGECHEGQVWEAALSASQFGLENVVAVVDYNKYCTVGRTNDVLRLEPFADKWRSFGWWVTEADGHDFADLIRAFDLAKSLAGNGMPKCIIAHTTKGKGIPLWEERHDHHASGEVLSKGIEQGRKKWS